MISISCPHKGFEPPSPAFAGALFIKLMATYKLETSPKEVRPPQPIVALFSLVAALFYQRSASGRCFLMTTHAFSSSKAQDLKNKPRINSWWTRRDSNALPPALPDNAYKVFRTSSSTQSFRNVIPLT